MQEKGYNIILDKEDIKAFASYLDKTLQFVAAEIKAGKSKADILKATIIPRAEQWKGNGIERPLDAAYEEIILG